MHCPGQRDLPYAVRAFLLFLGEGILESTFQQPDDMDDMPYPGQKSGQALAFPFIDFVETEKQYSVNFGLTKREYFAGLALQGLLSSDIENGWNTPNRAAKKAVEYADVLLAELANE